MSPEKHEGVASCLNANSGTTPNNREHTHKHGGVARHKDANSGETLTMESAYKRTGESKCVFLYNIYEIRFFSIAHMKMSFSL